MFDHQRLLCDDQRQLELSRPDQPQVESAPRIVLRRAAYRIDLDGPRASRGLYCEAIERNILLDIPHRLEGRSGLFWSRRIDDQFECATVSQADRSEVTDVARGNATNAEILGKGHN